MTGREGLRGEDADDADQRDDGVDDPWGVPSVVHLRAGGTSLLLGTQAPGVPRVLHWGADLGELSVDEVEALAVAVAADPSTGTPVLPTDPADGPGLVLVGPRGTAVPSPVLVRDRATLGVAPTGGQRLGVRAVDRSSGAAVQVALELDPTGVLRMRAGAATAGDGGVRVAGLHLVLPVPPVGRQVLVDVGGRLRPAASRRPPPDGWSASRPRPSEVVGAVVVHTAGQSREELWALTASTTSRRSEARRATDPLVRATRGHGGDLAVTGGEDVAAGGGETTWTTPVLLAAHGRSWGDVRTRLARASRSLSG